MSAYYNDNDPQACAWLRELIEMGELPDGRVDERSITDVRTEDIGDVAHFFAGIGGWPYALELAGWNAARPVWTASLPCQPFSTAGRGRGHEDERHLWPVFYELVSKCRPATIFGEQVAGKAGAAWISAVRADLESLEYAVGALALTAAGIGAPHIRQRLYWVAISRCGGEKQRLCRPGESLSEGSRGASNKPERSGDHSRLGNPGGTGSGRDAGTVPGAQGGPAVREQLDELEPAGAYSQGALDGQSANSWGSVVYVPCADGKIRPLEPGIVPLVDGLPAELVRGGDQRLAPERTAEARTMRLRGYGNAIVPPLAAVFVQTVMEYLDAIAQPPA